jgi:YVTN family beta-propeller protein
MASFTITPIPVDGSPNQQAMVPDGSRIYVTHIRTSTSAISNVVSVIDTTQNAVVAEINLDSPAHFITVSPDGAQLYVSHFTEQKLSVVATISNAVVTVPLPDPPLLLAVTPDGGHLYVAGTTRLSLSSLRVSIPCDTEMTRTP